MDTRSHWIAIVVAILVTALVIGLVGLFVTPATTAGLVALVIAATSFPAIAVWSSRVSSIDLTQATARSAGTRNQLLAVGIQGVRDDIKAAGQAQSEFIVKAINTHIKEAGAGTDRIVAALDSLREEIINLSNQQVQAAQATTAASARFEEATRELAEIQLSAEQRARPRIVAQTQVRPAWLFYRHNWIIIANVASPGRGFTVSHHFAREGVWTPSSTVGFDLDTQGQREIDLGDISAAGGSPNVWIRLTYRDDALHHYLQEGDLPLNGNAWIPLPPAVVS